MSDSTATNTLELSDEEFAKLPVPELNDPDKDNSAEPLESSTIDDQGSDDTEVLQENNDELQDEKTNEGDETSTSEEVTDSDDVIKDEQKEIDYKAAYEDILKPFKANGREMSVDNIEDVRQLMQMGANYNKKMAALKPNLKLLKILENNGLLDESKISYLIDLDKKNPDAIKKLIKDAEIDPLDVDINAESSYKPNTYTVNDKEVELDAVLSDIRETDTFNTTIDIVGNKWDEASKLVLIDNPELIKVINTHVGNGVYETITNEVEKLRMLGKLGGLSDIDAYKAVGDALYAPRDSRPMNTLSNNINTSTSKATNKSDPRLDEKRKAASTTKSVASSTKSDFNPLSMSDEEFEKIASSKFI